MPLVRSAESPISLRLARDLTRSIKRGHPWVYADSLRDLPKAPAGTPAVLLDQRKGQAIATGFYDARSPLAFRVCDTDGSAKLDDHWASRRLQAAIDLRSGLFDGTTTGYRLLNGEGDRTPGLVVDVYGTVAVLKLDGPGPAGFWQSADVGRWLAKSLSLTCVYERQKERGAAGHPLIGETPTEPVPFLEHGIQFTADIVHGQKTGFFLDQRENRAMIRSLAKGRTVLNLFAYTGGFSVAAGRGGASHVVSVDLAKPAIAAAVQHWELNGLTPNQHEGHATDAFEFLDEAARSRRKWNLVIVDPPSFAPNRESVPRAEAAYRSLIAGATRVTTHGGLLAAASCSSHIDLPTFQQLCEEGVSEGRRRASVLAIQGQPADHPSPLVLPEFRYLKFVLMRIE